MGSSGVEPLLIPKPVYVRDLFDGKVTIIVFGAPFNWNYAGASREEMEAKNPGIAGALEEVMHEYGIKRALVPKPAFNARVVTDADLQNELLPNFFRGVDADGVILRTPGDAYFLASADCVATIIDDPSTQHVAALHCGRDATIDRKLIDDGAHAKRKHGSVIDAAMEKLQWLRIQHESLPVYGEPAKDRSLRAFLAAGIRPETFTHPTWKAPIFAGTGTAPPDSVRNMRMIEHLVKFDQMTRREGDASPIVTDEAMGNIDLFQLVRRQLRQYGVTRVTEDEFDTATSKGPDGEYLFHSNRRDKVKRNLVIIKLN